MESCSKKLCHTLDHLGYNSDMIKIRSDTCKALNKDLERGASVHYIITGSKGEGISLLFESDLDLMMLDNYVQCIHTTEQLPSQLPSYMTVFLADMENVPSGYTRLKLNQPASFRNLSNTYVRDCLFESQGEFYLSSTEFTASTKKFNLQEIPGFRVRDISGPALPSTLFNAFDVDIVFFGFTFHCPQLLQIWASRRRQHEWPSKETIRTACSFLPQVVPVGAKGSDRQDQEWRFCFIESELTLTNSLNETQIKLYILMKMIAKDILKPVTSEISSYIMKNLIYWLSELLPASVFREEKLASLVLLALKVLRTAITRWKNLPYYMIPSRNLLSERLDSSTRSELSELLYILIQEGPRLFLRIEKLEPNLGTPCLLQDNIVTLGNMRGKIEKMCWAFLDYRKFEQFLKCPLLFFFNELAISIISLYKLLSLQNQHDLLGQVDLLQVITRFMS